MAGRKSTAALLIASVSQIDGRPRAPADLTPFQAEVWDRTVANEAADTFKTAALQQMLKEYCRHVDMAHWLEGQIQAARINCELDDLNKLVRMRDCETKASADKATKLRLTNQARYTPQAAATASKRERQATKPWQIAS